MEAIARIGENRYYLSSEAFNSSNPPLNLSTSLFVLNTDDQLEPPVEEDEDRPDEEEDENDYNAPEMSFLVPFGTKSLEYTLEPERNVLRWEIFDLTGKRVVALTGQEARETPIDLSPLSSSIYYLILYLDGSQIITPFFLD